MSKSERLDLRLEPEDNELIRRAAEECGLSVSAFLVTSARERAERVMLDRAFGLLDEEAWDDFVLRLAAPPTYKRELTKLFAEPDIFE